MRRGLGWLLLGVSLLPVLDLLTAEEACDKSLDLLGSDPIIEREKGRSNFYLLAARDLQG